MSTRYCLRDPGMNDYFDSFNQKLKEAHQKCMDLIAGMEVDPSMKDLKREILEELRFSDIFAEREPYMKTFEIGSSTAKCFYWMDDKGFDGLLSVQKFMEQNPRLVISNEYGDVISFSKFSEIVSPKEKKQVSSYSGKEISSKPSLCDLIHSAEAKQSVRLRSADAKSKEFGDR